MQNMLILHYSVNFIQIDTYLSVSQELQIQTDRKLGMEMSSREEKVLWVKKHPQRRKCNLQQEKSSKCGRRIFFETID